MSHIMDVCRLKEFIGGLQLLHEAEDNAVKWLESEVTTAFAKWNENFTAVSEFFRSVILMMLQDALFFCYVWTNSWRLDGSVVQSSHLMWMFPAVWPSLTFYFPHSSEVVNVCCIGASLCECCRDVLYVIDNIIKASFAVNDGFRAALNVFIEITKVSFVFPVFVAVWDSLVEIRNWQSSVYMETDG